MGAHFYAAVDDLLDGRLNACDHVGEILRDASASQGFFGYGEELFYELRHNFSTDKFGHDERERERERG